MKTKLFLLLLIFLSSQLFAQNGWYLQNSGLTNAMGGSICAINKDTVYVITSGEITKTIDGGIHWIRKTIGFPGPFYGLAFSDHNTGYAVGRNGTIIKTIDAGENWILLNSGTIQHLYSICIADPQNIWVVGNLGVILNSKDYGSTWQENSTLTNKMLNCVRFKNQDIGLIAGNEGALFKTFNGGMTWTSANSPSQIWDLTSITFTQNYTHIFAAEIRDEYGSYTIRGDVFFQTSDYINWTEGSVTPWNSKMVFTKDSIGFAISTLFPVEKGTWYIDIIKTSDDFQNWVRELRVWDPPNGQYVGNYCDMVFITDSVGYALSGGAILKTDNGGTYVRVNEIERKPCFYLFPNPATSDILNIELNNIDLRGLSIEICDIYGKNVQKQNNLQKSQSIDIAGNNNGVYFIKLVQGNRVIDIRKLIKLK